MKPFFLLAAFIVSTVASHATPVPLDIKQTVAFIYLANSPTNATPNGTGFFVGIGAADQTNKTFVYLVTARHVLSPAPNCWLPAILVRVNRHDGASEMISLPLSINGPHKNIFISDDPTVDIAIVPFAPDPNVFEFRCLPIDFITSEADFKALDIHEGSDVFFTGMFTHHLGEKRNTPITRFGKVALLTDEKVDWPTGQADIYLMEANSFPGNSGSPVFFQIGNDRGGYLVVGGPTIKLAGVMSGCYQDLQPIKTLSVSTNQFVTPNLGICGVVPSYQLKNILFSKELQERRSR